MTGRPTHHDSGTIQVPTIILHPPLAIMTQKAINYQALAVTYVSLLSEILAVE
jgi:hypothetical protein